MRAWTLVSAFLAGCLAAPGAPDEPVAPAALPDTLSGAAASLQWAGEVGERAPDSPCTDATCRAHAFTVELPADADATRLVVAVRWSHEGAEFGFEGTDPSFQFELEGPGAKKLGEGKAGFLGTVLVLENPAAGAYKARVWGVRTGGAYELGAVLGAGAAAASPVVDLLPDLVTMPLSELGVVYPSSFFTAGVAPVDPWTVLGPQLGVRGCGADEWAEERAVRCLRFSNGVANRGAGPLEVRLPLADAAPGAAGAVVGHADFLQRIYHSDGTFDERTAGPAEFHPSHGHYHFAGFAQTTLYAYDLETGKRGEVVVRGEKLGYCFIDVGVAALDDPRLEEPRYTIEGCLLASGEDAIVSGLQPGWFDLYWSDLAHQYIEITDVPDGVYELESVANVEGRILEADAANNAASAVFRLTGDQVGLIRSS